MIIDTSAIIAILRDESEAPSFANAIAGAVTRRISAVNYVEAGAAIDARAAIPWRAGVLTTSSAPLNS